MTFHGDICMCTCMPSVGNTCSKLERLSTAVTPITCTSTRPLKGPWKNILMHQITHSMTLQLWQLQDVFNRFHPIHVQGKTVDMYSQVIASILYVCSPSFKSYSTWVKVYKGCYMYIQNLSPPHKNLYHQLIIQTYSTCILSFTDLLMNK